MTSPLSTFPAADAVGIRPVATIAELRDLVATPDFFWRAPAFVALGVALPTLCVVTTAVWLRRRELRELL